MVTESGTLPIGVEFEGSIHREFVLRPLLARDSVEVMESEYGGRAAKNDQFLGLCLLAYRLEKLGDIPREKITPDLVMEFFDDDLTAVMAAEGRLRLKLRTFRGAAGKSTPTGAGADPHGDPV
jgi:hypothetical protein